jgi:hypothetical protein
MKILIIDSTNQHPVARRDAIANVLRHAAKGDASVVVKPIAGVSAFQKESDLQPDLLLLHASDDGIRDHLRGCGFAPLSELQYSEGGCVNGIPRSISAHKPISLDDATSILRIVREFTPDKRNDEFQKIWSGVPALLLLWILWKEVLPTRVSDAFDETDVAKAFNQLGASLQLRSDVKNIPPKCPEGTAPSLKDAKLLVQLARVDL